MPPESRIAPIRGAMSIRHLSNIQVLRGLAALMVLMYHIPDELTDRGWANPFPNMTVGAAGVDIFFVISGFIMVYSTARVFQKPGAGIRFLLRRVARVVPLYWAITTIFVFLTIRASRHLTPPDYSIPHIVASYLFLFYPRPEYGDFPLYLQGWTLNYEMFFYLCFSSVLSFSRGAAVTSLSICFVALVVLGQFVPLPWPVDRWANSDILEFVFGMQLAQAYLQGLRLSFRVSAALAVAGFSALLVSAPSVDWWFALRGLAWGPPATAIVAAAALYQPATGGRTRSLLESFGDASYSLYIVHFAFFVGLAAVLGRIIAITAIPAVVYAGLLFLGSIALALLTHKLFEMPLTRALYRRLDRSGESRPTPA